MKHILLILALTFCFLFDGWAGDSQFRHIGMEDGLPSNAVRNIVQDKYGYLWFGTDNGLCRYDGIKVHTYRIAENSSNQYISALLATDEGIYAGTDKGAFLLKYNTDRFERVPIDIHSTVTYLSLDKENNLWISTASQGIWHYTFNNKETHHYDFPETNGFVSQVYVDNANQIWAVSNWGTCPISRLNRLHDKFEQPAFSSPVSYNSLRMLQTRDGRLWLGTWEQGLMLIHSNGQLEQVLPNDVATHIHTLYERSDNTICIGCDDGLINFAPNTRQWSRLWQQQSQSDRFVYAITSDNEGGLWIGTFYGGVYYVSPMGKRFDGFTTSNGLRGNVISRFCEDLQGNIWIASDDGGIMCYSPEQQQFIDYPHQEELSTVNAHALALKNADLWIGTYTRGVYVLNVMNGQLRHYTHDKLADPSSYSICHDSKGRTWVATMEGFNLYDPTTDGFHHIAATNALAIDIDEDSKHRLWLSTQGAGLWRYSPESKELKQYIHHDNDDQSLPSDQVNCTMVDASGRLWIATLNGLCYYDTAKDQFTKVDLFVETGNVMSIIEDQGVLWISTERGIVKYEPTTLHPSPRSAEGRENTQRFTRHDGLVSEQFQPNSGIKASDGRIYFGGVNGFNAFYPYQIKANRIMPPVYIEAQEVHNQMIFSFVALSYCSPEKNQYAYMLDGLDKEWNYVGNQTRATYTNLPAGTYTFRVKATNNDGIWSDKEATITIVVPPPFWWTWYAKLFYLLLIIFLIWYYVHIRLKRAERRHQQELQRLQEQKEKEAREARLNFFTMVAHEIRTPVSLIIGPLEQVRDILTENGERRTERYDYTQGGKSNQTVQSEKSNHTSQFSILSSQLDIIDRNAHRLLELVNQLLDFRKAEQHMLVCNFKPQNINELLHAVCERFAPTFQQNGRQFTVNYPDEHFTAIVDGEAITKVVSNLLTNANKYSKTSVVLTCIVEPDDNHFRITVSDDGVGIREEERQRIFEPFYQAEGNKPGTGIGLNIVKNIVDLHHGTISVDSEIGKGSTFTICLPVSQKITKNGELGVTENGERRTENGELRTERYDYFQGEKDASKSNHNSQFSTLSSKLSSPTSQFSTLSSQFSTLLLVDDSDDMLEFLSSNLNQQYQIATARDGIEALDLLSKQSFDLIISDWMMPRMDGAELCKQVRSNPLTSHTPFILLTAKTDDQSKVQGMDIGADAYIEKPFSLQYLGACIRNIIALRRQLIEKFSREPASPVENIASNPTDDKFLKQMTQIIEENISNSDLSVNFLAEQLGISRSGLFAKIKTLADITPNEMIQVIRLKRAARLLREGKYLVSEVGYMVGFSNPSYFTKCFQKQFGIKPGDYIKK